MITTLLPAKVSWLSLLLLSLRYASGFAVKKRGAAGGGFGKPIAAPTSYHTETSDEISSLRGFLEKQKAKIGHVEVGIDKVSQQRGLYTTKSWKKGQIVLKIPSDSCLALADPTVTESPSLPQQGAYLLTEYLENEEAQNMWDPYLKTFPLEVSSPTPDLWEKDEIDLLEFPRCIKAAQDRKTEYGSIAKEKDLDAERLRYAGWLVTSRSVSVSVAQNDSVEPEYDDRGQVMAKAKQVYIRVLVPLLDMVNHANLKDSNVRMTILDPHKDNAWFALEATRNIPAGRELKMTYGAGGSSDSVDMLLNYGIVEPGNELDEYMITKGGDDVLKLSDWTTSIEEDERLLEMVQDDEPLRTILRFRTQIKRAYKKNSS